MENGCSDPSSPNYGKGAMGAAERAMGWSGRSVHMHMTRCSVTPVLSVLAARRYLHEIRGESPAHERHENKTTNDATRAAASCPR